MMNDRKSLLGYLQHEDVQERIRQNIQRGRSEVTVTIGRAADLFGFSENQLRDWEERGLLTPQRSTKQRQYALQELDKLATIRVLIDGGYSPGEILTYADNVWSSIASQDGHQRQTDHPRTGEDKTEALPINVRIESARAELFWRYYASQALRLSLTLICDELPNSLAGLVLPLQPDLEVASVHRVEDLPNLGESLVGWLSKTHSSHTMLTFRPSFQYSTDYSLLPLVVMKDDEPLEKPEDNTFIVLDRLDRRSRALSLSAPVVETIRHLLTPLYGNAQTLRSYFGGGMRDELDPAPNLDNSADPDSILDGLAEMAVHLSGQKGKGQEHRPFCCILLPKDPSLPLQQHTLIVRAQSEHSPHKVGGTTVSPDKSVNSLSLRAYQSGHVIYRPKITSSDTSIAHHHVEGPIQSAIALPIGGENGPTIAVLYIASYEAEAFSESYQRVLRMVGRMVEEVILTYRTRQQVGIRLMNAIDNPRSVDRLFEDFLSESDFVNDVDGLLTILKTQLVEWEEPKQKETVSLDERKTRYRAGELSGEVVAFIAVDIDNQSSLATKYGDQVARNLSKAVGLRIQGQQRLSANPGHRRIYHIHADRFYLLLIGIALEEARNKAKQLRDVLNGDYRVEARRTSAERLMLPERMLELSDVTVRLGVAAYPYRKLEELLQRHSPEDAVASVRAQIMSDLDEILNLGQQEGGNVITSWDVGSWGYTRWYPAK
jgi:DNA-binding transcriptional MerR regulator/GGDEF domain-containing protein